MQRPIQTIAFATFLSITLSACSSGAKDCNDPDVKETLLSMIQKDLDQDSIYDAIKLGFSGEKTMEDIAEISKRKDGKHLECQGTYSFTYNKADLTLDIPYSLQYLEDKKDTKVSVNTVPIRQAFQQLGMTHRPIKNGIERAVDEKTGFVTETPWKDNKRNGIEKIHDNKGTLLQVTPWENDKINGIQENYYVNGNLAQKITYVDGVKSGPQETWNQDGKEKLAELIWENGKASGWQKQYNPDGELIQDATFKDDKIVDGFNREYAHYGSTLVDKYYKDGKVVREVEVPKK